MSQWDRSKEFVNNILALEEYFNEHEEICALPGIDRSKSFRLRKQAIR